MSSSEDFRDAATDYGTLTQRQAENIADLAARRAEERLYITIGKGVIRKTLWALGAAVAGVLAWVNDWFHIGK